MGSQPTKDRPILFGARLMPRVLDGSKTVTRRPLRPQPGPDTIDLGALLSERPCPYGMPGDRLYTREAWHENHHGGSAHERYHYRAMPTEYCTGVKWRPSIHMPRVASRANLEVRRVAVERLQRITPNEVRLEGLLIPPSLKDHEVISMFAGTWDDIYSKPHEQWLANPFVYRIEFRRIT